jgi:hypothetical protein
MGSRLRLRQGVGLGPQHCQATPHPLATHSPLAIPAAPQVLYAKHIAKQKVGIDPTIWAQANHVVRRAAGGAAAEWAGSHAECAGAFGCPAARRRPLLRSNHPALRPPPPPPPPPPAAPPPPPQLLIRDPYPVIQSFSKVLAPTLQELGYAAALEIYSELRALG